MKLTLSQVVARAIVIYSAHEEAAEYDAGFDAGEFSGPAHDKMVEKEVEKLAIDNGFTLDQVSDEVTRVTNEQYWPQD